MRKTSSVRVLCALLFTAFTFIYLYCYQADVMVVTQHVASGGKTHYVPLVGAVLITLVLVIVQSGVFALTKLGMRTHALTYLPSLLILAFITSLPSDVCHTIDLGAWVWVFPVVLLLFAFVVFIARNYQEIEPEPRSGGLLSQLVWINLAILLPMFVLVGLIGNHDKDFHCRARTERLIMDKDYDKAYGMALEINDQDSAALMLRAYALSCKGELGERLFEHPVFGGSRLLMPNGKDVRTLLLPEKIVAKKVRWNVDYVLCASLIDCRLDVFLRLLKRYHKPSRPLPKYYKEALALYAYKYGDAYVPYRDENTERKLVEFVSMYKSKGSGVDLRNNYEDTYWYHYVRVNGRL